MAAATKETKQQAGATKTGSRSGSRRASRQSKKRPKLSRLHQPAGMTLEEWQIALRRQFGREQKFRLQNVGAEPIFSEFQITNPQSGNSYRICVRGEKPGQSFCSCPDFATNTLGTCKHIEFTLARLRRTPGAKAALRQGFRAGWSEVTLQYGPRREVRFRAGDECPGALRSLIKQYFDADGILRPDAFSSFETFLSKASEFDHDLRCPDDVLEFVAEMRDRDRRQGQIATAFPDGIRSQAMDNLLRVPLYDYQREGALFAARAGRCLIGDEMGLGKTAQAIAAAEIMAHQFGVERVLVICPTSLKHQWEREIGRFCGRTVTVIGGLRARRASLFSEPSFYKIANYDTVHADLDLIANWSPDLVILDEAQRIKNWNTRAARSIKKITSPYAVVLTGTPLENRLEELVSIIQFVDQHRLGPTFRFLAEHQVRDPETGRVVGYKDLDSIGRTLAPVLLRRHKDQVLKQLPERLDKHFFVPMTPQQRAHHEGNKEIVARIVFKWRRHHFLSEADQRRLMIALQNMRMSCNSTYLLDHETDFGVKADELATLLGEVYEEPGVKAVVFSQWTGTHELIERRFSRLGWKHVLFHGGVPGLKRKGLVDRFRDDDDCRTFLSTDAGGVGLNLQNASVVINMDLPWNPAVLEQRIGRVHRLGQIRPVRVVNFIAQGTIEEGMLSIIKFKKSLFAGILDGGSKEVFLEGGRLNRFIESVEKATGSIPAAAVEDPATAAEAGQTPSPETGTEPSAPPASAAQTHDDEPWAGLLQGGLVLLEQLAAAARKNGDVPAAGGSNFVARDERTGESYLKVPVPRPETIDKILGLVGTLLERFRA